MRKPFSYRIYCLSFAIAGAFLLFGAQYASAYDCEGPYPAGQTFDATSVGAPYDPDPTPKNNQFSCAYGFALGDTSVPPNTYQCAETTSQEIFCRHYLNPATDYYKCTYYGTGAHIGASYFNRYIFDNCTYSLVPPTVSFSAAPPTINLGESATLSWSSANATSCTASGGWSGPRSLSGSEVVTPAATTTYTLSCTGASTTSQPVTVTVIIPDTVRPTDPIGLTAIAISPTQINLAWNASTDSGGSGLAGYRVERCMGGSCMAFAWIANAGTISFSNAGLVSSTSYSYRVRAYDGAGNESVNYSNIATDTTQTPPDITPPTPAPVLSGSAFSSTQIDLSWTASSDPESGIVSYRIERNGTTLITLGSAVLAYSDMSVTASTAYTYRVFAINGGGLSTASNLLPLSTPAPPDITPPTFTFSSPAATLSVGTTFATLAGSTNEGATCRYSTTSGLAFTAMTLFGTTGTTNHSQIITGLTDGTLYTYYVKCRDATGNTNASDFSYMFQVDSAAPDITPPVISSGTPTGVLTAGTVSATMSVVTNENAYCRYNSGSDTTWSLMPNVFSTTGAAAHSVLLTGLTNGSSYLYYVRCQDNPAGNVNASGYAISFSIAYPANVNPVALITATPTSGTEPLVISADGSASYDTDGSIANYIWNWGDGSPNTTGVPSASHTYSNAGTYTLQLTVIDNQGGSGNANQTIAVAVAIAPPPPFVPVSVCTAACTIDSDCAPGNICGPAKFCIAQGTGAGPDRFDGYLSRLDGSLSQSTPGVFPAGTTSVIMSVKTDVNADCQYSTFINTPYGASVMKTFSTTGTTAHAVALTGLTSVTAAAYDYYVRCRDLATDIVNGADYTISFTTNAPNVVSGPNPYTCLINSNFVRSNIPYLFDICIPR